MHHPWRRMLGRTPPRRPGDPVSAAPLLPPVPTPNPVRRAAVADPASSAGTPPIGARHPARPAPRARPFVRVQALLADLAAGRSVLARRLAGRRRPVALRAAAAVVAVAAGLAGAQIVRTRAASQPNGEATGVASAGRPIPTNTPAALATLPILTAPGGPASSTLGNVAVPAGAGRVEGVGAPVGAEPGMAPNTIAVHAAGALRRPGVYLLPADARVDDLVAAAGGLTGDADPDVINLAAHLADAERVFVPKRGQVIPVVGAGSAGPVPSGSGPPGGPGGAKPTVDLNTATPEELDALPGVGPATASAIVEFRTTHGRFRSVNQLLDVPGIGDAKFAALRSRVTLS